VVVVRRGWTVGSDAIDTVDYGGHDRRVRRRGGRSPTPRFGGRAWPGDPRPTSRRSSERFFAANSPDLLHH
jgi:hypothetical protein